MSEIGFTLSDYLELGRLAKSDYPIVDLADLLRGENLGVVWRHDVDYSISAAKRIAALDTELGIQSTFFFNLHADTYNLRSAYVKRSVQEILSSGHNLAIHLDLEFYRSITKVDQIEDVLSREREVFESLFGVSPGAFSFHNPTEVDLLHDADTYAGMINCYSSRFRTSIGYVSDSNGYWRFKSLSEALSHNRGHGLQVLTHPEWWTSTILHPRERLAKALLCDHFEHMDRYDSFLMSAGRENRSALPSVKSSAIWNEVVQRGISTFNAVFGNGRSNE